MNFFGLRNRLCERTVLYALELGHAKHHVAVDGGKSAGAVYAKTSEVVGLGK